MGVRPLYGFATAIRASQSALFYGTGIPYNPPSDLEREQLLQFQGTKYWGPYIDKRLRDVYPINFLSDVHLALPVNGSPLKSWIEKRAVGDLVPLCQDVWVWQLPLEAVAGVRRSLKSADALIVTL